MEKCPLNDPADQTYTAIRRNIEAVAKLEENFVQNRSLADKMAGRSSDGLTRWSR